METDRRGKDVVEGEIRREDACVTTRADAFPTIARELGDGISQIGVFTEGEDQRNLGLTNYLRGSSAKSPSGLINKDLGKEYQLTKDEYEFTKEYLNKDFRKYDHGDVTGTGELFGRKDQSDAPVKLTKSEIERLRKSLFNESEYYGDNQTDLHQIQKPDYIIKNSEFLQKSNELLSKIAKERSYRKSESSSSSSNRDIDNRLISDYRKASKEATLRGGNEFAGGFRSKDELSLQNFGSVASYRYRSGSASRSYDDKDSDRYRYEIDGNRNKYHVDSDNDRNYSISDDEGSERHKANAEGISVYAKNIASLLAGYSGEEGSRGGDNDTEPEQGDARSGNSPTMYHHGMPHSPNLSLRQSSPYPVESTNIQAGGGGGGGGGAGGGGGGGGGTQSRHKGQHGGYQQNKKPSLRNNDKSDKNSIRETGGNFPSQREHSAIGLGSREHSTGTLTSRGRMSNRRHHQNNGMTSSTSSNSSISDNNDNYDVDHRGRLNIENDLNGDSPPEPAPPEVPPRGPSLHHTGNTHTLRSSRNVGDRGIPGQDIFLSQEYLMSGSPRNYQSKVPKSPNNGLGPNPEYATCDRDVGISKENTLSSENRLNPGLIGNPPLGVTPATPLMPVFPLRAPPANYSPYSPSRFHIDKRCQHRCTWKCFSIALILLTLILTALLAYFGAVSSMRPGLDATTCILVEDAKAVSQDGVEQVISSQSPTEESPSTSTHLNILNSPSDTQTPQSVNENQLLNQQQLQSHQQIHTVYSNYWPTVTEMSDFDVTYKSKINPLQFWNLEFKNKQPAFIRLNFTLPWGSNFAVYGRRNVAPTVTQYDFVEFVKGGRIDRLKRDVAVDFVDYRWKRDTSSVLFIRSGEGGNGTRKPEANDERKSAPGKNVTKRSSTGDAPTVLMVNVTLLQYFDTGIWFVSVYNDDVRPHEVSVIVTEAEGVSTACPNDCSSHGSCYLGKCDCIDGYEGVDCSKSVCPVLCSNHGKYGGGICHCEEGWKGPECDIPNHDCQVPDCSGHGKCVKGSCECTVGWKGPHCSEVDCLDPTCSNHGTCVNGKCYCKAGWQGANCSALDKQVYQCLPSCSEHGTYDLETGTCKCQPFWTGSDCSKALCSLDCGSHGRCGQGKCECTDGWTGDRCDLLPCDGRCSEHGQCKNGTCVCSQGWNGKHCTIPGCKNACSRHGMCSLEDGEYHCICSQNWAGDDCSIPLEQECNDEIDNDQDGMIDCSDSECCSHPSCTDHIMCLSSNDPVEVLLRKQPPSVTASFYQRVKFLIEENSVQSYAHMDEYSESRVSVMRGRVVTPQGLGIVGIRVSVDKDSRFGFTLTRNGGWFDVLVNGGGAVTLQFQRSPFRPLIKTVFVPWNQIVVLPPIQMFIGESASDDSPRNATLPPDYYNKLGIYFENTIAFLNLDSCLDHTDVKPVIVSSWAPEKRGPILGRSGVLSEGQVVQESISISGSELHLMYQSSKSPGYYSLLYMRLTGGEIADSLTHVHVRVEIEGSVYTKMYESDPNLTHVFAWNKRNVYKQKVYGLALAKISIGYQYSTCANVIWETQTATLEGFVVDISDIGGWSLDVHHHYNFHEGILQKGDGTTLYLKNYPRAVKVVMGTGLQRSLKCSDCNGPAKDSKLLTPVALANGPDGSLYVGDFNLIRRITPEGHVYTVFQLSATQVSYQYYLAMSPADGKLYISNPESHQILRVLILDPVDNPAVNGEVVVGSGERCIPGDLSNCGDLGPAKQAKLTHPKGLAIAADRTMYIADGTNIRAVDSKDIIHTLIGHHGHNNHWQPIPCKSAISAAQAQLQWPTGLALSPLDGSLHFIDDRLVLKLTSDLKIKVVAGSALHCQGKNSSTESPVGAMSGEDADARGSVLGSLLAIAFSPAGELYLAQSDSRKVNTIKVVDTSGKISDFAGKGNVNEARSDSCDCKNTSTTVGKDVCCEMQNDDSNKETLLSSNAKLYQISAITVGSDGVVHVADQGSLHILSLEYYLPVHDENGEFKIPYPATSEMYIFNRYGQHVGTRDLTSGKTRYNFLYSKNTSFGKLSTITDPSGNKILFLRDYSNVVSTIENTQDRKSDLTISAIGYLTKFSQKGKSVIDLDYESGSSGLLGSRSDSTGGGGGETFIYAYDKYGRVSSVVLPTGEVVTLKSVLSDDNKLQVIITGLNNRETVLTMDGMGAKRLVIGQDNSKTECVNYRNGSYISKTSWGGAFHSVAVARFPLLELSLPIEAEMLPMWSLQKTQLSDSLNEMEWKYSLVGDINSKTQQTVLRDIYVNHTKVLGIELDQQMGKETYVNQEGEKLLTVAYSPVGLPLSWTPLFGHSVNVSYDRFNRLESWTWGKQKETYTYERQGLLSGVTNPQDGTLGFVYNDLNMLSKLSMPSGRVFQFTYDSDGGLRHITLPSGTKHSFSCQPSLGFIRVTYTPPGSTRSYIQHYTNEGALLQTVHPGDGARVVYRYHHSGLLSEIIHGDGRSEISYSETSSNLPNEVVHSERDLEYKWDLTHAGGKLVEERIDYGSKTGLSNAKISYEYDDNFRVIAITGRIGGQNLPEMNFGYSPKSGSIMQIGQFKITQTLNETNVFDGTALFSRKLNEYFQETEIAVTIHRMEVFRMEFIYDLKSRISQTRTYTRNVGVNSYTNTKNFTWDADGQLIGVEAQEPWGFKYDANGNMLALNYRGNTIPMEYNVMDRIVKFGEGQYKYDNRGLVIQNAREERFHYNAKGLLVRATKRGRFDVRYFYDHRDRLTSRKDNYGNVTQFFYTNHDRPNEVSQIYSPRDGKLMSLIYDDRGHLIYAQVYRHKYYIATDECGTPVMVFNQYGEGIREIMRSPYGHIVYDSNPYLYLPVDFCGGLLDQVTSLVHMQNGQVYDPLIGQWMTPNWETILSRVTSPNHLHLYRFNGNDPINVHAKRSQLTDHEDWLRILGYDLKNLAPQLFSDEIPGLRMNLGPGIGGELAPRGLLGRESFEKSFKISSGFIATISETKSKSSDLSSIQKSKVKKVSILRGWQNILEIGKPGANSDPPFGKGIVVSRTRSGLAILNSVSSANPIYRDVFTSVFNRSYLLDLKLLIHGAQQDAFFFVKPETWKVSDDRGQLKRLGSQVNTTFHEKEQEMADIKIHNSGTVINLRYGTTPEKEKTRLLHHAKGQALRKAWHRERDLLRLGFPGSVEWSQSEIEEILKVGYSMSFEGEYVYDINSYPELAEDPFNIRFVKKESYKNSRKRKKRSVGEKKRVRRRDSSPVRRRAASPSSTSSSSAGSDPKDKSYQVRDVNRHNDNMTVDGLAVDFIKTNSTFHARKRFINKKCKIWWLSWVESC